MRFKQLGTDFLEIKQAVRFAGSDNIFKWAHNKLTIRILQLKNRAIPVRNPAFKCLDSDTIPTYLCVRNNQQNNKQMKKIFLLAVLISASILSASAADLCDGKKPGRDREPGPSSENPGNRPPVPIVVILTPPGTIAPTPGDEPVGISDWNKNLLNCCMDMGSTGITYTASQSTININCTGIRINYIEIVNVDTGERSGACGYPDGSASLYVSNSSGHWTVHIETSSGQRAYGELFI